MIYMIFSLPLWVYFIILIIISYIFYQFWYHKSSASSLPPMGLPSTLDVLKAKSTQKGILRVQQVYDESIRIRNTAYGAVFRLRAIPFLTTEQVLVTDYKLARIILLGDREKNIPESIKFNVFQSMNLIDREVSNIFT